MKPDEVEGLTRYVRALIREELDARNLAGRDKADAREAHRAALEEEGVATSLMTGVDPAMKPDPPKRLTDLGRAASLLREMARNVLWIVHAEQALNEGAKAVERLIPGRDARCAEMWKKAATHLYGAPNSDGRRDAYVLYHAALEDESKP